MKKISLILQREIKETQETIKGLKKKMELLKKRSFGEFLEGHFGRPLIAGDEIVGDYQSDPNYMWVFVSEMHTLGKWTVWCERFKRDNRKYESGYPFEMKEIRNFNLKLA